jgi:hypothetical protein
VGKRVIKRKNVHIESLKEYRDRGWLPKASNSQQQLIGLYDLLSRGQVLIKADPDSMRKGLGAGYTT